MTNESAADGVIVGYIGGVGLAAVREGLGEGWNLVRELNLPLQVEAERWESSQLTVPVTEQVRSSQSWWLLSLAHAVRLRAHPFFLSTCVNISKCAEFRRKNEMASVAHIVSLTLKYGLARNRSKLWQDWASPKGSATLVTTSMAKKHSSVIVSKLLLHYPPIQAMKICQRTTLEPEKAPC